MKWRRKYNVKLEIIHTKHMAGYSLPELSEEFGIPKTTLNRYFKASNLPVFNYYYSRCKVKQEARLARYKDPDYEYKCEVSWKISLIRKFGHKCMVCGYNILVEAHHILPKVDGGKTTLSNGCLLCPNHHAEAHAGIINIIALLKRGELLGNQATDNQQPSCISSQVARDTEGSETKDEAKALSTRAPRIVGLPDYLKVNNDDIVRTANI
jgi:AraC-like DNA-binding protein